MAHFNQQTLSHLKKLCKLDYEPEEEAEILYGLKKTLDYIALLDAVDTEGVEPCTYVLQNICETTWRDDIAKDILPRETFLANAPDQIGGMIRVPPTLRAP